MAFDEAEAAQVTAHVAARAVQALLVVLMVWHAAAERRAVLHLARRVVQIVRQARTQIDIC